MFRRLFRLTIKLGVIAGIGVGIAIAVKKLTAPPALPDAPLEPWPPLDPEPAGTASDDGSTPAADEVVEAVAEETAAD